MVHCTRGPDVNAPRRREAEGRPRWPGRGAGKGAERSGAEPLAEGQVRAAAAAELAAVWFVPCVQAAARLALCWEGSR